MVSPGFWLRASHWRRHRRISWKSVRSGNTRSIPSASFRNGQYIGKWHLTPLSEFRSTTELGLRRRRRRDAAEEAGQLTRRPKGLVSTQASNRRHVVQIDIDSARSESRRSPVDANSVRPISRSAGSDQGDAGGKECVEVICPKVNSGGRLLVAHATIRRAIYGTRLNRRIPTL
jgi:hypothetical protein